MIGTPEKIQQLYQLTKTNLKTANQRNYFNLKKWNLTAFQTANQTELNYYGMTNSVIELNQAPEAPRQLKNGKMYWKLDFISYDGPPEEAFLEALGDKYWVLMLLGSYDFQNLRALKAQLAHGSEYCEANEINDFEIPGTDLIQELDEKGLLANDHLAVWNYWNQKKGNQIQAQIKMEFKELLEQYYRTFAELSDRYLLLPSYLEAIHYPSKDDFINEPIKER